MSSKTTASGFPKMLTGFEHINRYWDHQHAIYAAKILPGEFYVSVDGELITTVLGSCVSACVRDVKTGIGGMNHFMLPDNSIRSISAWQDTPVSVETRYGNIAMERLINVILAGGAKRHNLEIKVFGGGKVLNITTDIGLRNIEFVRGYLDKEGFNVVAEDVGGESPRKLQYFPLSGRVRVKKLNSMHNQTLEQREKEYIDQLNATQITGSIDLF